MKKFILPSIIVSILFIVLSIIGIVKPDEEYYTTTGTIVRIEEYLDVIDDTTYYTPYIDYEVNDIQYKDVEYGAYNSNMQVGQQVTVYYLPEDPSMIQAEGYKKVPYITLGISLVFLAISVFLFIKK